LHQLKTDIRCVNVWPCASVMLDESRSRSRSQRNWIDEIRQKQRTRRRIADAVPSRRRETSRHERHSPSSLRSRYTPHVSTSLHNTPAVHSHRRQLWGDGMHPPKFTVGDDYITTPPIRMVNWTTVPPNTIKSRPPTVNPSD